MNIPSFFLMKSKSWLLNFGLIPIALIFSISNAQAVTKLSDSPSLSVPGNVALALSVEWPTALGSAYFKPDGADSDTEPDDPDNTYSETTEYLGYFDPKKCYSYTAANHYFVPEIITINHTCTGQWSGNFLNWALTQTIDPLRWALTGGYRYIDTASNTVLEKAWVTAQGGTTYDKTISGTPLVSKATPYNWNNFKLRSRAFGNQFIFSNTGDININASGAAITATPPDPGGKVPAAGDDGSLVYTMFARVQVCKPGFLESNCKQYGTNYKPEGLIQKNAMKLRFSAFGYINDKEAGDINGVHGDIKRDGGVLRAKMASLGPYQPVPGKVDVVNTNPEWDSTNGTFYPNPNSGDTGADTPSDVKVVKSGVINYLNEFGRGKYYKAYDPVSELYYSVLRYFKNLGNVSAYSDISKDAEGNVTNATQRANMKDGFPIITNWDDPIKYSCQKNFIIGVGDTNAWEDGNLPGSTLTSAGSTPPVDTTVDVTTATDRVGTLQGIASLGSTYMETDHYRRNTFYIAGLAYDAHTKDFRTDLTGDQTASTYWLDVLESPTVNCMVSPLPTTCSALNQYMLAAKYGGFDVPAGYTPYSGTPTWTAANNSSWDENKDGLPDTYFKANDPKRMKDSLEEAFNNIISKLGKSSSSFVVSSPNIATSNMSFGATFDTSSWTGNVRGNEITFPVGLPVETLAWNAVDKLELQHWDTGRYIATASCTSGTNGMKSCTGKPFRLASLSSIDQAFLGSTTTDQQNMLNFLRGDGSNEIDASGTNMYRNRVKKLGDIVGSKVVAVGEPRAPYSDTDNPGYSSFKSTYASRTPLVYVGANDGMLHAFQGTPSGGDELFAYIPQALFAGPSNPATPNIDGLAALSSKTFLHHYYVNATPRVADVNFGGGSGDWHTLLVGGLGKGGKAYYALDVTNPASLSNETNLATAVKWEFTHTDLGYSFDQPLIVKTAKYGWVVIVTSGYNNTDGQGYFFVIKASDGSLLEKVATGAGSITNDAGLAHATAFVPDYRDGTADAVYAGDLLGNVWRLDLTGSSYSVDKIAYLTTSGSQPQPITVTPIVEYDQSTSKRYVFVGTGRMLDDTDFLDTQPQTFYAINDGTRSNFFDTATLPSGVSFPITRSNLDDNTSTTATDGIGTGGANKVGWFVDLGSGTAGYPYRIDNDMASNAGVIAFFTNAPDGDVCTASGTHQLYAMAYGTGKSLLYNGTTTSAVIIKHTTHTAGLGTNASMYKGGSTGGSGVNLRACNDGGICLDHNLGGADSTGFKQLNWRELPTAE